MVSLYDMTIPVCARSLENLAKILQKAEQWADENEIPHSRLIEARIAADMGQLPYQIQSASRTALHVLVHLVGQRKVLIEDNETTFSQLSNRIRKTIELLRAATPENFAGKESMGINMGGGKFTFTGVTYVQYYLLPNFFFHVATAYDILRMEGVPLGQMDFLGAA